ncbi:MAG3090 family protein [Mycoplasmopsis lipofaciens]|uniref:MAG3090 family protein n=1 Tax=Mycoplasmopsis lipofaciens TaxID=114884 RepID=UPI000488E147|nr:hypothetical protein [Mycoplasmopsis lipofaciens]
MKRLNCTYEAKKDPKYPWLLKHPKVKKGLAKFQTRQEALEWYMTLNYETAIWFQNDKRIFDGQLTIDAEENDYYYYVKTSIFDGGATYEGVCREIDVNPVTFKKNDKAMAQKRVNRIDFVLLHDPETYFPPELEISKKTTKKDLVDVEAIKAQFQEQIDLLLKQLDQNNAEADKELQALKEELAKKDSNFEEMSRRMDLLRQNNRPLEGVEYKEFKELNHDDKIGALALYIDKVKKAAEGAEEQKISQAEYNRIKENYDLFDKELKKIENDETFENSHIVAKMHEELELIYNQLLNKFIVNTELNDEASTMAYYYNEEDKMNVPVSYETSFVLVKLMHVGFIAKKYYTYVIPYLATKTKYAVTVISGDDFSKSITIESTQEHNIVNEVKEEPAEAVVEEVIQEKEEQIIEEPVKEEKVEAKEVVYVEESPTQIVAIKEPEQNEYTIKEEIVYVRHVAPQKEDEVGSLIVKKEKTTEPVLVVEEHTTTVEVQEKPKKYGWLVFILILILLGLIVVNVLAIIQLVGAGVFFPVA